MSKEEGTEGTGINQTARRTTEVDTADASHGEEEAPYEAKPGKEAGCRGHVRP